MLQCYDHSLSNRWCDYTCRVRRPQHLHFFFFLLLLLPPSFPALCPLLSRKLPLFRRSWPWPSKLWLAKLSLSLLRSPLLPISPNLSLYLMYRKRAQSMNILSTFYPVLADVSAEYIIWFYCLKSKMLSGVTILILSISHLFPMRNSMTSGLHYVLTSLSHPVKFSKLAACMSEYDRITTCAPR